MVDFKKTEDKREYSLFAKILHWGFIFLFAYGIYKQVDEIEQLEDVSLLRFEIIFALIFLIILVIRFLYMRKTQKSSLPENTSKLKKFAAKVVHLGMYLSLGTIAITGLAIGFFYWIGFKEGIIIEIIVSLHEQAVSIIYWLIPIHILAAIYHRLLRDGVWGSMVPFWKE